MNYSFIMLKPDALDRELVVDVLSYLKKGGIELELVGYQKAKEDVICKHYAEVIEKLGDTFRRRAIRYFDGQPVMPIIVKGNRSLQSREGYHPRRFGNRFPPALH